MQVYETHFGTASPSVCTKGRGFFALLALLCVLGCEGSQQPPGVSEGDRDAGGKNGASEDDRDGSQMGDAEVVDADAEDECTAAAHRALQDFLKAHRDCASDADCTHVGDCGPHIQHEPVNVAFAEEARELQEQTCGTGYDGLFDGAKCEGGQCVSDPSAGGCCGCPEPISEADYYVRYVSDTPGTLTLSAADQQGNAIPLLASQVSAGDEQHIFHVWEGTGGHVMPSNSFADFQISKDGGVVYQGVVDADWAGPRPL